MIDLIEKNIVPISIGISIFTLYLPIRTFITSYKNNTLKEDLLLYLRCALHNYYLMFGVGLMIASFFVRIKIPGTLFNAFFILGMVLAASTFYGIHTYTRYKEAMDLLKEKGLVDYRWKKLIIHPCEKIGVALAEKDFKKNGK